jgi:hypothetical protein
MKYLVITLALAVCLASLSLAAEERWRNSNGDYGYKTYFGGTWHPGTLFIPASGKYPVFLKTGHFGFDTANVDVQVKLWTATGSTVSTVLASFPATTKKWPTWTDVDLTTAGIVIKAENFFLSTNNPQMGPLGSAFIGSGIPGKYPGYHYWSANDVSWSLWTTTDWAVECTVDTNHGIGIAPASVGRVKALYR